MARKKRDFDYMELYNPDYRAMKANMFDGISGSSHLYTQATADEPVMTNPFGQEAAYNGTYKMDKLSYNDYDYRNMTPEAQQQFDAYNQQVKDNNKLYRQNQRAYRQEQRQLDGSKTGGALANAIPAAANAMITAFQDKNANTATKVATALGAPELGKIWSADWDEGNKQLDFVKNKINDATNKLIQDSNDTQGAFSAIKNNNQLNLIDASPSKQLSWKDFRGNLFKKGAVATLQGAASGSVGGPWGALGGATVGTLGALFGGIGAKKRAKRAYEEYKDKLNYLQTYASNFNSLQRLNQQQSNENLLNNGLKQQRIQDLANINAYGGNLFDDGGDLGDDYVYEGRMLPEAVVEAESMPWYEKWYNKGKRNLIDPISNRAAYAYNYFRHNLFDVDDPAFFKNLSDKNVQRVTEDNQNGIDYILGNDFQEENQNDIRRKADFINTPDTLLGDRKIPLSAISTYYGIEDGKLKAGTLDDFDDNTTIVPNRAKNIGKIKEYHPVSEEYKHNKIARTGALKLHEMLNDSRVAEKMFDRYFQQHPEKEKYLRQQVKDWYDIDNPTKEDLINAAYDFDSDGLAQDPNISKYLGMSDDLLKYAFDRNEKPGFVVTENNDTIPNYQFNEEPKGMFADENGHSVFFSGKSEDNVKQINDFLSKYPSYPVMLDNGRYFNYTNNNNVNEYTGGFMDPQKGYIIGTEKALGGNLNNEQNINAMGGQFDYNLSPNMIDLQNQSLANQKYKYMNQIQPVGFIDGGKTPNAPMPRLACGGKLHLNKFDFGGVVNPTDPPDSPLSEADKRRIDFYERGYGYKNKLEGEDWWKQAASIYEGDSARIANLYENRSKLTPDQQAALFDRLTVRTPKIMEEGYDALQDKDGNWLVPNSFDFGGSMNGMDIPTGMQYYENGGTHEENPNGGIQVGVDNQGTPNLVEEGEFRWGDYVFSNRIDVDLDVLSDFNVPATKKQGKKANKGKLSYADLAKKMAKKAGDLNDPITKDTLNENMKRASQAQDFQKAQMNSDNQLADYKNALKNQTQGNPMYGSMKYNGMGNVNQGLNEGSSAMEGVDNSSLSNVNRSGNEMMAAYGGNLFANGGRRRRNTVDYDYLADRFNDSLPTYQQNVYIPNEYGQGLNYAGTVPMTDYGTIMQTRRLIEPEQEIIRQANPLQIPVEISTMRPINFGTTQNNTSTNTSSPTNGSSYSSESYKYSTQTPQKTGLEEYTDPLTPAESTQEGLPNSKDQAGIVDNRNLDEKHAQFATATTPTVPTLNTAGLYAQLGKGLTKNIYNWAGLANTEFKPNYKPEQDLRALGKTGYVPRTADHSGMYRAADLYDINLANNAAQAQAAATARAMSNVNDRNQKAANQLAADYNAALGVGNNYQTMFDANMKSRLATDEYNKQTEQTNVAANNDMYRDNQNAGIQAKNFELSANTAANQMQWAKDQYADTQNRIAALNKQSDAARMADNQINFLVDKAKENAYYNLKNKDPRQMYWNDPSTGEWHFKGDNGYYNNLRRAMSGKKINSLDTTSNEELAAIADQKGWNNITEEDMKDIIDRQAEREKKISDDKKAKDAQDLRNAKNQYMSRLLDIQRFDPDYKPDYSSYATADDWLTGYNRLNTDYLRNEDYWKNMQLYDKQIELAKLQAKAYGGKIKTNKRNKNHSYDYMVI